MQKKLVHPQSGLTTIELLITVAIITTLALIAQPVWQTALLKARRAEARSALHATMLLQERYYTQHNTYCAFSSSTNSAFKWWSGDKAETSYYEIRAEACPGKMLNQCILLTAISDSDKVKKASDPVCGNLMLDSTNRKSYSKSAKANPLCW